MRELFNATGGIRFRVLCIPYISIIAAGDTAIMHSEFCILHLFSAVLLR